MKPGAAGAFEVPAGRPARAIRCRPPGSKSLTNRALIAAALCRAPLELAGALESEDTERASAALRSFGCRIEKSAAGWRLDGTRMAAVAGQPEIQLGNAGTAMRFLAAVFCALGWPCRLDGTPRMRERPIEPLLAALRELGGTIACERPTGCPPVLVGGGGIAGGNIELAGSISSQFFSGLMLAAPLARAAVRVHATGDWVSKPYIEMTAKLMRAFGVEAKVSGRAVAVASGQRYVSPGRYEIEPDASAATYPLGLGALHGVPVALEGLGSASIQGDMAFAGELARMGARLAWSATSLRAEFPGRLQGIESDLSAIPDAAMTLVTLACVAQGRSHFTGLANLRLKESDRIAALETELNKLGARVRAGQDGFSIEGVEPSALRPAEIATYDDHRIAMCLGILGTLVPGTRVRDPGCVAKTYPRFWEDLALWLRGS